MTIINGFNLACMPDQYGACQMQNQVFNWDKHKFKNILKCKKKKNNQRFDSSSQPSQWVIGKTIRMAKSKLSNIKSIFFSKTLQQKAKHEESKQFEKWDKKTPALFEAHWNEKNNYYGGQYVFNVSVRYVNWSQEIFNIFGYSEIFLKATRSFNLRHVNFSLWLYGKSNFCSYELLTNSHPIAFGLWDILS